MAPGAYLRSTARYSTWNVCWREGREHFPIGDSPRPVLPNARDERGDGDPPVLGETIAAQKEFVHVLPAPKLETMQETSYSVYQLQLRLHSAAREGCLALVVDSLAAGANVGVRDLSGRDSGLDLASANGHLEVMRAFIKHGADVNSSDVTGTTALHKAAAKNQADAVFVLVEAGADVNAGSSYWLTPLQSAIIPEGAPDAAAALLLHGADPNKIGPRGRAPLDLAAQHGRAVLVRMLLAAGADVNYRFGEDKFSALDEAAANGHVGIMKFLIHHGADVNASALDCQTALHCAARHGMVEAVRVLVEEGARVEASDSNGCRPLHVASSVAGSSDVVVALLAHGANIGALDNRGQAPLHLAAECGRLAAVTALLAAGADVTLRYGDIERSALDCAAVAGNLDVMQALVEHGVDVNAGDSRNANSLHRAGFNNQDGAIDLLIEAGAAIDTLDTAAGWTALHYACELPAPKAVRALLRHGADFNAQFDTIGELDSPLHVVAREAGTNEGVEIVELLLAWGADETSLNAEGKTAADIARDADTVDSECSRENVERVLGFFSSAPGNRAWRRRRLLVMCRAWAHRVGIDKHTELGGVAARLLCLEEEGLFREIVVCL